MRSSAPWIWPMITSWLSGGTCATGTDARSSRAALPAGKFSLLLISVRAWSELRVVAPSTGAQNVSSPPCSRMRYGGDSTAGSTVRASPLSFSSGRESRHPAISASCGPAGVGAPGPGGVGLVHAARSRPSRPATAANGIPGRVRTRSSLAAVAARNRRIRTFTANSQLSGGCRRSPASGWRCTSSSASSRSSCDRTESVSSGKTSSPPDRLTTSAGPGPVGLRDRSATRRT